ncbi:methyltransferase domain-containing protein [Candidatus Dependentiae bacterium]|nr:methyltransferase domain-containing protein [Candidatus Dependentiae bacterium]
MENVGGINFSFIKGEYSKKTVLDFGCGNGNYSVFFLKKGFNVVAVDIKPDSEETILKKLTKDQKYRFKFFCLNAEKEELPKELPQLDYILCREVLEHIKNYKNLIDNFYKKLNTDGVLIVSVPNSITEKYFSFWDPDWVEKCKHVNIFTRKELIDFFDKNNFKIFKKGSHSFRRTIFWSLVTPFRINHDMGRVLSHKKLTDFANFISNGICYFKFIDRLGNYIIPKSWVFYLKKKDE